MNTHDDDPADGGHTLIGGAPTSTLMDESEVVRPARTAVGESVQSRIGGRYEIESVLGEGGMGEVFVAKHIGPFGFQKRVVIKRIHPTHSDDEQYVDLFLREARLSGRLNHPNVVQTFELIDAEGDFFLVMEHLEGMSWRRAARTSWSHHRPLNGAIILSAIEQAARGLHHAHTLLDESGQPSPVIHRDISEDNLFFSYDGATKVLDFGIATSDGDIALTQGDELRGKVPYMSPEQIQGKTLDARSDMWSLGVTFYWLLTGKRPFDRARPLLTMDAILNDDLPDPRRYNPALPADIVDLCTWPLQRAVEARPQSAAAFAERCTYVQLTYGVAGSRGLASELKALPRSLVSKKTARQALKTIPASIVHTDSTTVMAVVPGPSMSRTRGDTLNEPASPAFSDDTDGLPDRAQLAEVAASVAKRFENRSDTSDMLGPSQTRPLDVTVVVAAAPPERLDERFAAASLPDVHSTDSESDAGLTMESAPFEADPGGVAPARVIHEEVTQLAPASAGTPIETSRHPIGSPAPLLEEATPPSSPVAIAPEADTSPPFGERRYRNRLPLAVLALTAATAVFVAAAALLFGREDPEPVASRAKAAGADRPSVPVEVSAPLGDVVTPPPSTPLDESDVKPTAKATTAGTKRRKLKAVSSTKTPDTKTVALKAPRHVTWSQISGRRVQKRKGKVDVPIDTAALLATDPGRGSTHRVPLSRGVADFGALPQRKVRFLALPARAVVKYKTGKVIGTIPFSPLRLKVGTYVFRFVFDNGSVVDKAVELKAGEGEVRVAARRE